MPEPRTDASTLRRVIFASSLGTLFEWYDFYLYGSLAIFFGGKFFPPGNETAQLLASLATFGAGFGVRPLGALVFGHIGDRIGRKYTFLVTMATMGLSTALVGFLPTYERIGIWATVILVVLRLLQGLALGGEYGGAATYVAEHAPDDRRGYYTSFIQTTATLGFFLSMGVIGAARVWWGEDFFKAGGGPGIFALAGWRVPFLLSFLLLAVSLYIRVKMQESPLFTRLKASGKASANPFKESFTQRYNLKFVLIALLGATAGQGVVWYTGQFYALTFLQSVLKVDWKAAYLIVSLALVIGTPFFLVFGHLSDRIGRKRIMLAGCALAALTYVPIYMAMRHFANPGLLPKADPAQINLPAMVLLVALQLVYVAMVYGPIAAFLVELFPTRIRYTSMSLPYHIGNGWFGGFLPLIATAVTASASAKGAFGPNALYTGLAYPIAICLATLVVGALFLKETRDHRIDTAHVEAADHASLPFGWGMPALALAAGYAFLVLVPFKGLYLFPFFGAVFWFMLPVVLFQFKFTGPRSLALVLAANLVIWPLRHAATGFLDAGGGLLAFSASALVTLAYAALLLGLHKGMRGNLPAA